ncbi:MAG TPA: hypothetical protein VGP68_17305 [Gemmataceae bacterium]|jgi:hypothetical protein|nr:hypothetical protein [Gemmataceae bacterium]
MSCQEKIIAEHRKWLSDFDPRHLKFWNDEFSSAPQSALCEAAVRDVLQGFGFAVVPWADLEGKARKGSVERPDFRCSKGTEAFYVEVANISIAKASEQSGLPHPGELGKPGAYGKLTKAVFEKALKKTTQCDQDLPTLLAVGTFHTAASYFSMDRLCANRLLTGEPMISWNVDKTTGKSVGPTWQSTNLKYASFIKPGGRSIVKARRSISGILLCGFGRLPASIIGVLHPLADKPFKPDLLPQIMFGRVRIDHAAKQLVTEWPDEQ